jgi:hypothetical protein
MNLFVCSCVLIGNSRMVSTYLVLAENKGAARKAMRDGEHKVFKIETYGDYVAEMGWTDLSAEQETDLMGGKPVCLVAGT